MTAALKCEDFDTSIRPQDDLFRHVNGGWMKTATIDDDKHSAGAFVQLRDESEIAVRDIINSLAETENAPDSEAGKIGILYSSFMDEATIEELGAAPLDPVLARVDAISSIDELVEHWGWSFRNGISQAVGMDVESDPGHPTRSLLFVGQSGLGLPDESYYREEQYAEIREKYVAHIEHSLTLAGVGDAAAQAQAVFELETRIAALHWDRVRRRDLREMYNLRTWEQLVAESPIEWAALFAAAKVSPDAVVELVVMQPSYLQELPGLLTDDTLEQWKSWARWKAVASLSAYLSSDFVNARFDFYDRTLMGVEALRPRWKRGVALVEGVMGEAVGKIYVERHFPPVAKERMDELVAHLLEAYRQSIETLDWMTPETREQALDKLSKFRPKIGYPVKWRDYSGLKLTPGDLIANVRAATRFELDYALDKLGKPVDPDEWLMFPQTVNAYYHPLRNEIVFPAAILQPPFFNVEADDAVNFGGIGAVIGHEIGHGFDDQGSTCDGDGTLRDWWTEDDRNAFEQRTGSLISQFDALAPAQTPDSHVNGKLTIGENIGDLGGVGIALKAFHIATQGRELESVDGLTPEQRFFFGYASVWQSIMRDEAMKQRLAVDPHSPAEFRCNQIVRNVDAFYEAFDVQPGDALWLEESERVSIW